MRLFEITSPRFLLHGTSTAVWPAIQREGLRPRPSHDNPTRAGVYLTNSLGQAEQYAELAIDRRGGDFLILLIDATVLDENLLEPDDYDLQHMIVDYHEGRHDDGIGFFSGIELDDRLKPYRRWQDVPWWLSLEVCEQVVYTGTIPPDAIRIR